MVEIVDKAYHDPAKEMLLQKGTALKFLKKQNGKQLGHGTEGEAIP